MSTKDLKLFFANVRHEFQIAIQSALERGQNLSIVQKKYESCLKTPDVNASDADKKNIVDQAFRDCFLHLSKNTSSTTLANQTTQLGSPREHYKHLVTLCIGASRSNMCSSAMPVILLSDIFDTLPLDQCEELFSFVEENVKLWKEELFFNSGKNNILRMCNDILRRLSRSQNTVFCGRILLFLARFFPLSERSGLNVVSEFNFENVTIASSSASDADFVSETEPVDDEDATCPVDADDHKTEEKDPSCKIDYLLYSKFWALQDYFRNPVQCYNKSPWQTFQSCTSDILQAFDSYKLDDMTRQEDSGTSAASRQRLQGGTCIPSTSSSNQTQAPPHPTDLQFFPKYLTSSKLLELQVNDSNFRRYILLQFLILFQYLTLPVKFKSESATMTSDQLKWLQTTTERIFGLLGETPPDGKKFVTSIKHILKREENWNKWKNDGCPEFKDSFIESTQTDAAAGTDATPATAPAEAFTAMPSLTSKRVRLRRDRPSAGDQLKNGIGRKRLKLGNPELTKLWNLCPDNLEACRSKDRDFLPTLESYFAEALEQADPANMIEDQYKKVRDGNFGWRAIRLLARRSPYFFILGSSTITTLPDYLESMIKKISAEFPSKSTNQVVVNGVVPHAQPKQEPIAVNDVKTEITGSERSPDEEMEHESSFLSSPPPESSAAVNDNSVNS